LLPRLHTHFEKFVDYGIVVSISKSRQFRETLLEVRMSHIWACSCVCNNARLQASLMVGDNSYTIALDDDGEEICALFREVFLDPKYKSAVRSLRKEHARGFMQELQEVRFHLRLAISTAQRCNCRHLKEVLRCFKKIDFSIPLNEYL
jgi:hypothetical protein